MGFTELIESICPQLTKEQVITQESTSTSLKGKSVAVYSLDERIALRFGQVSVKSFDDIRFIMVKINQLSVADQMNSLERSYRYLNINSVNAQAFCD